jgi:hypothetical protein
MPELIPSDVDLARLKSIGLTGLVDAIIARQPGLRYETISLCGSAKRGALPALYAHARSVVANGASGAMTIETATEKLQACWLAFTVIAAAIAESASLLEDEFDRLESERAEALAKVIRECETVGQVDAEPEMLLFVGTPDEVEGPERSTG